MIFDTIFNIFRPIAYFILIIYVGVCILMYTKQDKLIFPTVVNEMKYPEDNPDPMKSPAQLNLKFKEVKTKTKDGLTLVGWFVYIEEDKPNRTMLYFHENAGSK